MGWGVELSPSGRAKCCACKREIPKGVARIFAVGREYGHLRYDYFHDRCGIGYLNELAESLSLQCEMIWSEEKR